MSRNICRFLNLKAANIFLSESYFHCLISSRTIFKIYVTVFTKNNTHILCK